MNRKCQAFADGFIRHGFEHGFEEADKRARKRMSHVLKEALAKKGLSYFVSMCKIYPRTSTTHFNQEETFELDIREQDLCYISPTIVEAGFATVEVVITSDHCEYTSELTPSSFGLKPRRSMRRKKLRIKIAFNPARYSDPIEQLGAVMRIMVQQYELLAILARTKRRK